MIFFSASLKPNKIDDKINNIIVINIKTRFFKLKIGSTPIIFRIRNIGMVEAKILDIGNNVKLI